MRFLIGIIVLDRQLLIRFWFKRVVTARCNLHYLRGWHTPDADIRIDKMTSNFD